MFYKQIHVVKETLIEKMKDANLNLVQKFLWGPSSVNRVEKVRIRLSTTHKRVN